MLCASQAGESVSKAASWSGGTLQQSQDFSAMPDTKERRSDGIWLLTSPVGRALLRLHAYLFHGLVFRRARPQDLADLFAFRFRVYCQEGYLSAEDCPEERFEDQYDPVSVSVLAVKRGVIVGAGRATPAGAVGLQTLECFHVVLPEGVRQDSMLEMGRFMVAREFRGRSRLVSIGLSIELRAYLRSRSDIEWIVASMDEKVRRAFQAFVPFEVLDERPLEKRHLDAREALSGYYDRNDARPVIAKASDF